MSDLEPGTPTPEPDAAPLTRRAARDSAAANRFAPNYRRRRIIVGVVAGAVVLAIVAVIVVFTNLGDRKSVV